MVVTAPLLKSARRALQTEGIEGKIKMKLKEFYGIMKGIELIYVSDI